MNKPVLVVMAAGIGSRYGGGVKQLAKVGPSGEIIVDYSIYDAKNAGFEEVIFVIRRDLEKDFREAIGDRLAREIRVEYAYQELDDLPEGFVRPRERTKPWGTGQAVLACRNCIHSPFAVINADDYYGKAAFEKMFQYLSKTPEQKGRMSCAMAGFVLENTLSENGTVTRGICILNQEGTLSGVEETKSIIRDPKSGNITGSYQGRERQLEAASLVSMNFWGFTPDIIPVLEDGFVNFLDNMPEGDGKAEYLLPEVIDGLLKKEKIQVSVLPTEDQWFGITYAEDQEYVAGQLSRLTAEGQYPDPLFG